MVKLVGGFEFDEVVVQQTIKMQIDLGYKDEQILPVFEEKDKPKVKFWLTDLRKNVGIIKV